jgi:drug/metabolite transporter (DMT)-like permease
MRVVLWMTGALLSFSVMAVSIRGLAGALSIMEILTVRSATGLVIVFAVLALRPHLRADINLQQIRLHLVRNGMHFCGQFLWSHSLLLLPLATVFALEFTMPGWTMLLAVLVLGERLTRSRIGAVVFGLVGVLIIMRPGIETFRPAALLPLGAALAYAASLIATKKLTGTQSTMAIVFWMNLMQLPMGLAGSDPLFFMKLGQHEILPVIGIAIAGTSAHFCLANAFRSGDASVVVPLDFLRIPLIALVGWWLYGEPVDAIVFLGAGVIIAGVLWNLRDESRRR